MNELNQHILNEIRAIDIVAKLIKMRQRDSPWKTISWYSKMLGLKSRSNLSEAIRGKRSLKQEHWRPLLQYLELNKPQQEYILLLREYEHTKTAKTKNNLLQRLTISKKMLENPLKPHLSAVKGMNLAHEIYCAISTFAYPPTEHELRSYFHRVHRLDFDRALHNLIEEGLIQQRESRYFHKNTVEKQMLKLHSQNDTTAEINYLKEAMQRSEKEIEAWYRHPNLSFFGTSIISVKRHDFEQAIQEFKHYILTRCLELETEEADMLISVNFQVYPTGRLPE